MQDNKKYWLMYNYFRCKVCNITKSDYNEMLVHLKVLHGIDNEKIAIRNIIGYKGVVPI